MFQIPIEWFVCPETKQPLTEHNGTLVSPTRVFEKHKHFGFWNFMPAELTLFDNSKWAAWTVLQENATIPYRVDAERNLGVGPRQAFLEFGRFCEFRGLVLDVGVGPQTCPTHIKYNEREQVQFIGLDPLEGDQPRDFPFVQGLGEYLPFKDSLFDQVLFVTSLDHFVEPSIALREAKRVLKQDGDICIWLGEKDKNAPKPEKSSDWYEHLQIPEGAEDPFHYKRLSLNEFHTILAGCGLKVAQEHTYVIDPWRTNCFCRVIAS